MQLGCTSEDPLRADVGRPSTPRAPRGARGAQQKHHAILTGHLTVEGMGGWLEPTTGALGFLDLFELSCFTKDFTILE